MHGFLTVLAIAFFAAPQAIAATQIIDFENLAGKAGVTTVQNPAVADGVTVTPVYGHFDVMSGNPAFASSGTTALGIHNGADGSGIRLAFAAPISVVSFDVTAWIIAVNGAPQATVQTSEGGTATIGFGATGTMAFDTLTGFADVAWIEILMPKPSETCVTIAGGIPLNCSTMFIDTLALATPVAVTPVALSPAFPGLAAAIICLLGVSRSRGGHRPPAPAGA